MLMVLAASRNLDIYKYCFTNKSSAGGRCFLSLNTGHLAYENIIIGGDFVVLI